MKVISINFPEEVLVALEELVDLNHFPNRSEAIRIFVHDGIIKEFLLNKKIKESKL